MNGDPRHAAMAVIVRRAHDPVYWSTNANQSRVENVFLAFECTVACDFRTDRDRAGWPFGQQIWDEVYPPDAAQHVLGRARLVNAVYASPGAEARRLLFGGPR